MPKIRSLVLSISLVEEESKLFTKMQIILSKFNENLFQFSNFIFVQLSFLNFKFIQYSYSIKFYKKLPLNNIF